MTDRQPEDIGAEGPRKLFQLLEKAGKAKPAPRRSQYPLKPAMERMILDLCNLQPVLIPASECYPENLENLGGHLLDLAKILDAYILASGIELRHQISPLAKVDVPQYFSTVVTDAIEEAAYECRRAAQILREERAGW